MMFHPYMYLVEQSVKNYYLQFIKKNAARVSEDEHDKNALAYTVRLCFCFTRLVLYLYFI